ncbi:hypothetical protein LJB92_02805 [Bacteroidales bacterium OttesenSCG-928-M06]|nr:hypothetical protein [Bacteroidales bacterium OttesenSCG-928-M06]
MTIQQHLDFKDLFPAEQPLNISQYLDGISRYDLIRLAMLFIHMKEYDDARSYTITFTSGDNPAFAQYMLNRLSVLKKGNPDKSFYIGSNITGLKLLQYIYMSPPIDKTTKTEADIVVDITKALSLINQNNINDPNLENRGVNQDSILPSINKDGGTEDFIWAKNIYCNQVVYSDFVNYPIENLSIAQILKADRFFKFCETNPKFKILTDKFLKEYGCSNSKEYLKAIIRLIGIVLEAIKTTGYPIVKISSGETFGLDLLSSISLDKDEILPMASNYDSLDFRNKPLIKISDSEFYITSNTFVIERLYNSIKFNLNNINIATNADPKKRVMSDVFGNYTSLFSEKFLFNNSIESIYKKYNYKLIEGGAGKCDYFVKSGNKVFLFECKDIEYASNIKQSDDFSEIKDYIWKKLVVKAGKPIGAGQIVRDIKDISDNTTTWGNDLTKNLQIFPILVLSKPLYSTLGFNYMLNQWFSEELSKESISNRIRIRPLLIIDMDTLLLLEDSLASKRLKLETEIENYYSFIKKKGAFHQKYLSFSDYIISQRSQYVFSKSSQSLFYDSLTKSLFDDDEQIIESQASTSKS